MAIYTVNARPSKEKIDSFDHNKDVYYRFQNPDHEAGTQSWGQIYSTPEEAIEDESTVLNGKSCCSTAHKLYGFCDQFDKDYVVLVMSGWFVEVGHDDEDVIDIDQVLEVWSYEDFKDIIRKIEDED